MVKETDIHADKEEIYSQAIAEIYKTLARVSDEQLIENFFQCLFTPVELHDIAKRWLLVREIDKGTTQREIARMFNMSLCKITRGSRELKKPDSAFRVFLDMGGCAPEPPDGDPGHNPI